MKIWHNLIIGSHVVLVGLIDAGFLYEEMGERVHPLGKVGNNIRYKVGKYHALMDIEYVDILTRKIFLSI